MKEDTETEFHKNDAIFNNSYINQYILDYNDLSQDI